MRKVLILALVLVLVVGTGSIASARQTKQITFWHIQETGSGPELIQQAVDRFMADNPTWKLSCDHAERSV